MYSLLSAAPPVWPDWVICWTLGNFYRHLAIFSGRTDHHQWFAALDELWLKPFHENGLSSSAKSQPWSFITNARWEWLWRGEGRGGGTGSNSIICQRFWGIIASLNCFHILSVQGEGEWPSFILRRYDGIQQASVLHNNGKVDRAFIQV